MKVFEQHQKKKREREREAEREIHTHITMQLLKILDNWILKY